MTDNVVSIKKRLLCGTSLESADPVGSTVKAVYRAALPEMDSLSRADLVLRLENMADTADLLRTLLEGTVRINETLVKMVNDWHTSCREQEKTFQVIGMCIRDAQSAKRPADAKAFLKIARDHCITEPWPEIPHVELPDLAQIIAEDVLA